MRPSDDKQVFFDMQEHPENYSEEQLEQIMAELDKEPDVEAAWEKILSNSPLKGGDSLPLRERHEHKWQRKLLLSLQGRGRERVRFAAVFAAFAFLGIMSLASYRAFFYKTTTDKRQQAADTTAVKTERFYYDVHNGDTIFRFENIRLDSIMTIVSKHYKHQVVFKDKAPAHLRLFITCHTSHTLREFVEQMNMFDGFHISKDFDILYVESDEKKEGKR